MCYLLCKSPLGSCTLDFNENQIALKVPRKRITPTKRRNTPKLRLASSILLKGTLEPANLPHRRQKARENDTPRRKIQHSPAEIVSRSLKSTLLAKGRENKDSHTLPEEM